MKKIFILLGLVLAIAGLYLLSKDVEPITQRMEKVIDTSKSF